MSTRHLAEFNLGILKHDWDDPRVADFVNGLDLVNGIAARSPGFVWRMPDDQMEAAQLDPDGPLGARPRLAATLSVWEDAASLEHFVWKTVHKRFYDRRDEWYDVTDALRMVLWWVPAGQLPDIKEAMERFTHLDANGDSAHAFRWKYLKASA